MKKTPCTVVFYSIADDVLWATFCILDVLLLVMFCEVTFCRGTQFSDYCFTISGQISLTYWPLLFPHYFRIGCCRWAHLAGGLNSLSGCRDLGR
jgi:hypothetical protein